MDDELYHQAIVALARQARDAARLEAPSASATVSNPLCGDRATLDVTVSGQAITAIGHKVRGCLLCKAAATVITEAAPGADATDARSVAAQVDAMLKASGKAPEGAWAALSAFRPVIAHKSRHDCVLLPFQALVAALEAAGA